jgi:hypothetical protein
VCLVKGQLPANILKRAFTERDPKWGTQRPCTLCEFGVCLVKGQLPANILKRAFTERDPKWGTQRPCTLCELGVCLVKGQLPANTLKRTFTERDPKWGTHSPCTQNFTCQISCGCTVYVCIPTYVFLFGPLRKAWPFLGLCRTSQFLNSSKVHPCTGTEALYRPYGP